MTKNAIEVAIVAGQRDGMSQVRIVITTVPQEFGKTSGEKRFG